MSLFVSCAIRSNMARSLQHRPAAQCVGVSATGLRSDRVGRQGDSPWGKTGATTGRLRFARFTMDAHRLLGSNSHALMLWLFSMRIRLILIWLRSIPWKDNWRRPSVEIRTTPSGLMVRRGSTPLKATPPFCACQRMRFPAPRYRIRTPTSLAATADSSALAAEALIGALKR